MSLQGEHDAAISALNQRKKEVLIMLNYIYDGSFDGLMTAIYEAKYRRDQPDSFLKHEPLQISLYQRTVHISTEREKADKVTKAIKSKLSASSLQNVYYTFLSELEGSEKWIFDYLDFGWKVGKNLDLHIIDKRVSRVLDTSRKVGFECHRMHGLIRFRQLSKEIYYAHVTTDYNILTLIAPHFAERFADQCWIIHDIRRNSAVMYNTRSWILSEFKNEELTAFSDKEYDYQNLWKKYFKSIAISSRTNIKLQKRCMPVRYWKHLTEK